MYDKLNGSLLPLQSDRPRKVLKAKGARSSSEGQQDLPKENVTIDRKPSLSEAAAAAINAVNQSQQKPTDALQKLIKDLDFSEFLQNATMLNPTGVSAGINGALLYLMKKADLDLIGPVQTGAQESRNLIPKLQEEAKDN